MIKTAIFSLLILSLLGSAMGEHIILDPPFGAKGTDVAIIWIHGMQCKPDAYRTIAKEVQEVAKAQGQRLWIGIPEFAFDVPEPVLIGHYVTETKEELEKHGFKGDNLFMAAHSLGGVMT